VICWELSAAAPSGKAIVANARKPNLSLDLDASPAVLARRPLGAG